MDELLKLLLANIGLPATLILSAYWAFARYVSTRDAQETQKDMAQNETNQQLLNIYHNTSDIIKQNTEKIDSFSTAVLQQFQVAESTTRALAEAQAKLADALTRMTGTLESQGGETRSKLDSVAQTVQKGVESVQTIINDGNNAMTENNKQTETKLDKILSKLERIERWIEDQPPTQETPIIEVDQPKQEIEEKEQDDGHHSNDSD